MRRQDNMHKLLLLLALACVAGALPNKSMSELYKRTWIGDTIDKATMKLLKASYDLADDKNVVTSPLGLMVLLSLYNSGANDPTRDEINQFLAGSDYEKLRGDTPFAELSQGFSRMDPEYLTLANKVYVSNRYSLTDLFASSAAAYVSDVDQLDFTNRKNAATVINEWASEKTKGNIKEPVTADNIDPTTAAALFNIIYFKGHWHVPFEKTETKEKDFYLDKETTVKKPLMHLLQTLYYTDSVELGAQMIDLPYKEEGFHMVVVLPDELDGLPSVLEKAAEKGLLNDIYDLLPPRRKVELDMPKFETRSKLNFNSILQQVGVSKLFSEAAPGIVKGTSVKVSKVFQEAFIKVDEEGATAGAFTGVFIVPLSGHYRPPPPLQFKVDHPFLYAIMYEDKILFAGTYTK